MQAPHERLVVGCMSGTSLDGLDAALVRIPGRGLAMTPQLIALRSAAFDEALRADLKQLASGQPATARMFAQVGRRLGDAYADLIVALCDQTLGPGIKLDFIVAHGQTIWHGGHEHLSWQLLNPWPIAHRLGAAVCYDLRQADLVAAGQGAPITPLADWIIYRAPGKPRWIVNLGGVCNVTWLPPADAENGIENIRAGDVGPCNLLIDGVVGRLFPGTAYDHDGELARRADHSLLDDRVLERIATLIESATAGCRTLGREQFGEKWLNDVIQAMGGLGARHAGVAMAVKTVAQVVTQAIGTFPGEASGAVPGEEVVLCGGGARNPVLVERIMDAAKHSRRIMLSDELGVPCEAREAMAIAVLGALARDGVPITLAAVTGRGDAPLAGTWVGRDG